MSYNRYAKRTDTVQADIVTDMRKAGIEVWIIGRPVDLLTRCRGHYLPVELKSTKPTHAPDPRQKEQLEFIAATGCPVVRTAQEAIQEVIAHARSKGTSASKRSAKRG